MNKYTLMSTIHTICTIHTNTYQHVLRQTITYKTDHYRLIHILHVNTHMYIPIQMNIYQYVQNIAYAHCTKRKIHINTYQDRFLHTILTNTYDT